MKKSNSKSKALGAFRKLGAVALITATLAMCFTACKQTGGGGNTGGESTPKHAITFSVEGENGTLKAKAYGVAETTTSPITVEEGKTVTFTAKANAGYRVKGWTLDGNAVNGTNNSYSFTVTKPAIVKVSFENNSTPRLKHEVNFSVEGENGTLTAKVDERPITSGDEIEEGKTVTFTATANDFYRVKEWNMDGNVVAGNTSNTYTHTVTKAVTVKVSFEANSNPPTPTPTKYTVTLNQTANGKVTASPEIPADKQVAKDTEITFTAQADAGYKIGKWTVMPETALQANTGADGSETAKVKITADTQVSVSFELLPHGKAILTLDPDNLDIKIKAKTEDGSAITVEGCNEPTLASDTKTTLHARGTTVILKGKITELDCRYNMLTELNVQGLTSLQVLDCRGNQLSSLNVQGLTALKLLDCGGNNLIELNVQGCAALQTLYCIENQLPSLNVQGLIALKYLSCYTNKLTALNVQGLTTLKELYCGINQLPELNVQGLTELRRLSCQDNQLPELNVQSCTSLKILNCSYNQLTALNVQGLTYLKELYCAGNQIKAQAMTKLLNALPARESGDGAFAILYTEKTGKPEGNCKDYTQPEDLKTAFDEAKKRNWKLHREVSFKQYEDI